MSTRADLQTHADEIMAQAAATVAAMIAEAPAQFVSDRLGRKLTYALADSVTAAAAQRDYSNLAVKAENVT